MIFMKKIFLYLVIIYSLVFSLYSYASDSELDYYGDFDMGKTVTPQEYQEAIDTIKSLNENKGRMPKPKKKPKLSKEDKMLQEADERKIHGNTNILVKPYMLMILPCNIYNNKQIISKGYYNAVYKKDDNGSNWLLLKQGHQIITALPMVIAEKEPDNDQLYYADTEFLDSIYLKIMYGEIEKHFENIFLIAK